MKWFKHDTNSNMDAKLKHVRAKYGMEGYGLFWYILELIGSDVSPNNLDFDLEHDAELISLDTNIHVDLTQEMMTFMVNLGLFENHQGIIRCVKMLARTDEYTQKLIKLNQGQSGQTPDSVPTNSRQCRDKVRSIRREEKRLDKNGQNDLAIHNDLFDQFWANYPRKQKKQEAKKLFLNLKLEVQKQIVDDNTALRFKGDEVKHVPHPTTYLNQERWLDPIEQPLGKVIQTGGLSKEAAI